ncbi:hypothetical protein FNU76_00045 [Chitinimonas arctica]|uniref:Uncharacterized protein n=1 Tax=Chitinimonas arctica TaxID=2594795 RepID=A0A516S9Y5_9NEIS|nr:hypothetical protein [Chitinimonas arctica]QDQ24858.1 hypothetical protein FNU76_00045 [Chitinimonas arctica]
MYEIPDTNTLAHSTISGVGHEGLTITTADGRPARLAIIDDSGTVLDQGDAVAREAWNVTLAVYMNLLIGKGYLRVYSGPPPLLARQS